jgi:hypothetical protein
VADERGYVPPLGPVAPLRSLASMFVANLWALFAPCA